MATIKTEVKGGNQGDIQGDIQGGKVGADRGSGQLQKAIATLTRHRQSLRSPRHSLTLTSQRIETKQNRAQDAPVGAYERPSNSLESLASLGIQASNHIVYQHPTR